MAGVALAQVEEITLAGSAAPTRFVGGPPATFTEPFIEDIDDTSPVAIHTAIEQPTASQPSETLSVEEKEERRQLIRKIGRYKALFSKQLDDISTSGLQSMPIAKLRDLEQDVSFLVSTRRSAQAARGLFIGALQAGELAGPLIGLELQGLASVAASSEDLLLTVDECAVRYEKVLYVDPVARLALVIAQIALAVDSHNRRQKTGVTPVAVPVVPAVAPAGTQAATYDGPPPAPVSTATRPDNIQVAEFQDL